MHRLNESSNRLPFERSDWWREIGLMDGHRSGSRSDWQQMEARRAILRGLRPEFVAADDPSCRLTLEQVTAAMDAAEADLQAEIEAETEARRLRGWAAVRAALTAPDADEVVETGDWAGFTRGRAIAWCWNLYQFEPMGAAMPKVQLRMIRLAELRAGGIPDGFNYARRAAELEAQGMTPESYRQVKEALGATPGAGADVGH